MTASQKSYFLVPNFNYSPGGPIVLGNIIGDACFPAETLLLPAPRVPDSSSSSSEDAQEALKVYSVTEKGCRYERSTHQSRAFGAWAQFLELLQIGADKERTTDTGHTFSCQEMRTDYILPSLEALKTRVANNRTINQVMKMRRGGLGARRSVYIITGLMIAKGLTIETEAGQEKARNAEIGVDAAALSGGAVPLSTGVRGGRTTGTQERTTVEEVVGDRVFAYQLSRLRLTGFHEKKTDLQVGPYRTGAFYSLDEGGKDSEGDAGVLEFSEFGSQGSPELAEEFDDELDVDITDVMEGGDLYRCIAVKKR